MRLEQQAERIELLIKEAHLVAEKTPQDEHVDKLYRLQIPKQKKIRMKLKNALLKIYVFCVKIAICCITKKKMKVKQGI